MRRSVWIISCFLVYFVSSASISWAATTDLSINPFGQTSSNNFNFVVAGDFGCDDNAKQTINSMNKVGPELVIGLGDLSYNKTAQCWLDMVSPLDNNNRVRISIGEHDLDHGLRLYNTYVKHFSMAKPFYSFDHQNVHFLAMATAKNKIIPYNITSEQFEFVKDDLEKAHSNPNIKWIIVYQFRSFYSSLSNHPGLDKLQDIYHPLFEKYGVDLVFQAHNHNYQRTYPIRYNEISPSTPIVTNSQSDNYGNNDSGRSDSGSKGQVFLTVETGGKESYKLLSKAPFVVTQFLDHGFLNVDIVDNGKKLTGKFIGNTNGKILDQFSIIK